MPIEYPALVKEAFLNNWHASAHRTEILSHCASMNEKWCWVLSRNQMFIWEKVKPANRASIPTQLPLPTSGLPRSAKCVVVYDGVFRGANKTQIPGVVVISPEGVLRHWTSIESQNYVEKVLDINSEVALRVEMADEPCDGKSASFLLTTTSGTVYFLNGEGPDSAKTGALSCHKVVGREATGIRRRLSSIMFGGQQKDNTSMVTNTFSHMADDLLVVAVSPDILTVYNMLTPGEVWSLKNKDFFTPKIAEYFKTELKRDANMVRTRLIDAAVYRGGLMVLLGGTHEDSTRVHMFLVWIGPEWTTQTPTKLRWEYKITMSEHRALFLKKDDSIYSTLTLCIPQDTSEAKNAATTDGVIILNPYFAVTVFLPFNLEKPIKKDIVFRHVAFPSREQLIGYAICKRYVYVMMLDSGVSTIRLLPRGFSDGTDVYKNTQVCVPSLAAGGDDWPILSELLSEMVASGLPKTPVFQSLHRSFEHFTEKDMNKASEELIEIVKMADQELARVVAQFLFAIIDYSDAANKTDTELHAKRVLTSRFNLFLQHMYLYERIVVSVCPVNRGGIMANRTGAIMLGEIAERVAATTAIWTWKCSNEANAAIFDAVIEKVLRIPEVQELGLKDKDALFGRCGLLHHIPMIAAQQLDKRVLTKVKTHRLEVFHAVCELLSGIKDAIVSWRLTKIEAQKSGIWWTMETFADSYRFVSERIIEELREGTASDSERTRLLLYILSIYDFYLSEIEARPDNDKVLQDLISLGKPADAMALAEKHRDFGTLVKNYLTTDPTTRTKTFERYKKAFVKEDFEMYLCDYLKRHGRNDVLLQQNGKRVDEYLDNFKELRFSREIANKQFGKAALTLMSLAESETKSFEKFADFLTRAHYCASCCKDGTDVSEVLDFYKRRYPEMKHRLRIPIEILKTGYGSDLDVMMSVEEMLEWNMANQPNDEATVDGFARAFHLLADLLEVHPDSDALKEKIEKTWKALVDYDEWNRVRNKEDMEKKTIFGKFCQYLTEAYPADKGSPMPAWLPDSRLTILPTSMDAILEESMPTTTGNHAAWIKGHVKWVKEQLNRQTKLPEEAFYRPDTKEVGSLAQAALEGFGAIFERREQRFIDQLNRKNDEMEH
ncbi:hypothetical protein CAEBREN_20282 [Caenorhabditis brenneri]|uniref:Uncharacterized protein n=1 Tax=Caenorhabditis brenneri TaxID=135651 RepID=G0MGE7_CAEBE|nr:hypothetical protein CAEBREN_20282 [Caenorhabditis brenneri]